MLNVLAAERTGPVAEEHSEPVAEEHSEPAAASADAACVLAGVRRSEFAGGAAVARVQRNSAAQAGPVGQPVHKQSAAAPEHIDGEPAAPGPQAQQRPARNARPASARARLATPLGSTSAGAHLPQDRSGEKGESGQSQSPKLNSINTRLLSSNL